MTVAFAGTVRSVRRRGDRRGRRERVGRRRCADQTRLQRERLDAHVGEQVDRRLLHREARRRRRRDRDCCRGPTTTGPCRRRTPARRSRARRASARDWRCPARRSSRSPADSRRRVTVVSDSRIKPGGPEPVVEILVPFVAERAVRQRRRTRRGRGWRRTCCARSASCLRPPAPESPVVPELT